MKSKRVGIFNQPAVPSKKPSKIGEPWEFKPSMADTRAGPAVGAGTYWGRGVKAPIGKVRSATVGYKPIDSETLKKPPKSLA